MAPGTSSMLRARRRDVNIKPNRILDRNSSRGMIYENEELRLRTININAEVERGQMDIKKLRRENDQLRREIWNLRDEYERLESLLKSQQEPSSEEEDEEDEENSEEETVAGKDDTDQENATNQEKASQDCDGLSVVEEEPEDVSSDVSDERPRVVTFSTDNKVILLEDSNSQEVVPCSSGQPSIVIPNQVRAGICDFVSTGIWPDSSFIPSPQLQIPSVAVFPGFQNSELEQLLRNVAAEQPNCTVLTPRGSEVVTTAILQRRQSYTQNGGRAYDTITCAASSTTTSSGFNCAAPFPRTEDPNQEDGNQCERYNGPAPPFLRLNSVQPFTVVFPVQSQQLHNLSVQEVIDTISEQVNPQLMGSLRGVRLVGGNCFLSLSSQQDAESILATPLTMRGVPLLLEDASSGTAVLALNGVPHDVADEAVATVLSNFGTLVGPVERRFYKGVDTGERLARLRARLAVPRSLWLGGCRVSLRVLQDEEVAALTIARRKSFRSHLNVRLHPKTTDATDTPPAIPPLPSTSYNQKSSPTITDPYNNERLSEIHPGSSNVDDTLLTTSYLKTTPTAPANTPVHPSPIEIQNPGIGDSQTMLPTTPTPSSTNDTPFIFPAPQVANTYLDPSGLRRVNSVMGTSSMPSTLDISHIRSQSTPPCVTDLPVRSTGSEPDLQVQSSNPASPSIIKRPLQRHRPSRKAPKVNTDTRKMNGECSASSSSGQDSPSKPNRRRASVYFGKRDKSYGSILNRTTSIEQTDGTLGDAMTTCSERERSNSDVSSRISVCRRKLSTTGRESGKVPWCGCWGNGCI